MQKRGPARRGGGAQTLMIGEARSARRSPQSKTIGVAAESMCACRGVSCMIGMEVTGAIGAAAGLSFAADDLRVGRRARGWAAGARA